MTLAKEYKSSLKSFAVEELFDLIFYRPIAFVLVKIIKDTGITPNQLTSVALIFGVIGGFALAYGTDLSLIIAGFLFITYNVFDCMDGQLARLKKNGTKLGRILDGLSDYIVGISAYIGIGIYFSENSAQSGFMWFLTAAAGLSNIFQAGLLDYYRNRYLDQTQNRKSILVDELEEYKDELKELRNKKGNLLYRGLLAMYIKYSGIQQKLTHSKLSDSTINIKSDLFVKKNKFLIHFWTYLGPTTQWTLLIICIFINRIDIYLWSIIIAGNFWAMILISIQQRVDYKLKLKIAK